jgi:non-specific serine/threonine protein kinase
LAAGLTQEALAERARISAQAVGALERGDRRSPQRETRALLADALALDAEERAAFETAAVRQSAPRAGKPAAVAGPWPASRVTMLPLSLTSFVGREAEVDELATLVRAHRLVTLTGPGGIGKTRTALEVAAAFVDGPGAVRLVELAPLGDPAFVAAAIAAALEIQLAPNQAPLDALRSALRAEDLLVLLDNCEHVIGEAASVAEALLRACPMLRILATSREPLRVTGERIYRLSALPAPALEDARGLGTLQAAAFPSVVLFTQRAQAVDHRFAFTDETAPHIAEICARLDGIPLAIELAATRAATLPVAALSEKLDERFSLLAHGGRTAPARQQTLHAAIDWSYDLLSEAERRIFEQLCVFSGGCTLEIATAVCTDEGTAEVEVFELLESLAAKSLIGVEMSASGSRYNMLESFREYGRGKLARRNAWDALCARHATAYCELAMRFESAFREMPDRDWHASARLELDNWRNALEWSLGARNDVLLGQRLAARLKPTWQRFGFAEGRRWIRRGLELVDAETPLDVSAELERAEAAISEELGEFGVSLAAALRATDRYRALGDRLGTAWSQVATASILLRLSRQTEAEPLLREALESARVLQRDELVANVLYLLSMTDGLSGKFARARAASDEALATYQRLGKGLWSVVTMTGRAEFEFWAGETETALAFLTRALEACSCQDDTDSVESVVHANAAAYLVALGRYDEAFARAHYALEMSHRLRFELHQTWAIQHLAAIAVLGSRDHPDRTIELVRAARLMGFIDARYVALGATPEPTDRQESERVLGVLRETLTAEDLEVAMTSGATMGEDEAIETALLLGAAGSVNR